MEKKILTIYVRSLIIILTSLSVCSVVFGEEYYVSSASEIENIMNNSVIPGDTLIMENGIWEDSHIIFAGNGAHGDSITLRAETAGHVIIIGNTEFKIAGTYLIVRGLRFLDATTNNSKLIDLRQASHSRITNISMVECNPVDPATHYHWLVAGGLHNRVDHNFFSGQRHRGVSLLVRLQPGGNHLQIDHNHFANKPQGEGNGYESLKVGTGAESNIHAFVTVEYNYFYRCDGEVEIISNKSHNNIYRYNTFEECMGTLTLRQGTNVRVDGNYFLGNNVEHSGGIRITSRGHTVVNNYFQDLGGQQNRSAIVTYAGMAYEDYVPGEGGHIRTDSVTIAHNTIVNCAGGIYSGHYDPDDPIGIRPKDNIFSNNIVTIDDDARAITANKPYQDLHPTWEGNLLFGNDLGDLPDSGYTVTDPRLGYSNGWFQLGEDSPAIDSAIGEYPFVIEDIDGTVRDAWRDIGADEYGTGPRLPLTPADVGPSWLGDPTVPLVLILKQHGAGQIISDSAGGLYEPGSTVELTAYPDSGWAFTGWTGTLESSANPLKLIMDTTQVLTATFRHPDTYEVNQ